MLKREWEWESPHSYCSCSRRPCNLAECICTTAFGTSGQSSELAGNTGKITLFYLRHTARCCSRSIGSLELFLPPHMCSQHCQQDLGQTMKFPLSLLMKNWMDPDSQFLNFLSLKHQEQNRQKTPAGAAHHRLMSTLFSHRLFLGLNNKKNQSHEWWVIIVHG